MLYVYKNGLSINGKPVKAPSALVFEKSENEEAISVEATEAAGAILISGLPIDEKISWSGPFVLNTKEQLYQAYSDYRGSTNGFEAADEWQSDIQNLRFK